MTKLIETNATALAALDATKSTGDTVTGAEYSTVVASLQEVNANHPINTVLAGPASGSAGPLEVRALVAADIPAGLPYQATGDYATNTALTDGLADKADASATASALAGKVAKAGDTMTGALTLPGAPTSDLHAATKKYVDDNAGGGVSGLTEDLLAKAGPGGASLVDGPIRDDPGAVVILKRLALGGSTGSDPALRASTGVPGAFDVVTGDAGAFAAVNSKAVHFNNCSAMSAVQDGVFKLSRLDGSNLWILECIAANVAGMRDGASPQEWRVYQDDTQYTAQRGTGLVGCFRKTLTRATIATFARIPMPNADEVAAGKLVWSLAAIDSTNHLTQTAYGEVPFTLSNEGGVASATLGTTTTLVHRDSGGTPIGATFAAVISTTNVDFRVTGTYDLTVLSGAVAFTIGCRVELLDTPQVIPI
jgi:hypothetical protein